MSEEGIVIAVTQNSDPNEGEAKQSQYIWGTGKRKCAIAQVRLFPGDGEIIVNGKPYEELFPRLEHRRLIELPFLTTDTMGKFRTTIKVMGGGVSGQARAICLGITRAMVKQNELLKPILRKQGLLTRDARIKERKKYGLKRARKAPQYTKR
jgi:small subunit ribosomal protein S9